MKTKIWGTVLLTQFLLASAVVAVAQEKSAPERTVILQHQQVFQGPDNPKGPPDTFVYVASEMNFDGPLVKGAPYSAQAVTETTQTLSDGNRIVNKSTASVYRDSEGRTRREHTLAGLGPFAPEGDAPQTISINDPVAGVNFVLDPRSKTAFKMMPMQFKFKLAGPPGEGEGMSGKLGKPEGPGTAGVMVATAPRKEMRIERAPFPPGAPGERVEGEPEVFVRQVPGPGSEGGITMTWQGAGAKKEVKSEQLGKQVIEGVEAEGSRTTITIPAGTIGNERAIEMISERWYSPELKVVVMTRHSDPRTGETTYRLTNILRGEQPKSLFEVPTDYTVKVDGMGPKVRTRKPGTDQ